MTLYVRQTAWLNAVPEEPRSTIAVPAKVRAELKTEPPSRLKKLMDAGEIAPMPSVAVTYLTNYLWRIGPTLGDQPLNDVVLQAWQRNTGIELQPWECDFIRHLSIQYLIESQRAVKADCPAPYGEITRRLIVARKVDAIFG